MSEPIMLALVRYGPGDLRLDHVPRPGVGSDDVLVRVSAASIDEADLNSVGDGVPFSRRRIAGRAVSGVVVEIGASVVSWQPGDRVTAQPRVACGRCIRCRAGAFDACEEATLLGASRDGGCAQFVCLPERSIVRLPAEVPFADGSLMSLAATALHALLQAGVLPGDTVAILGTDALAMVAAQWARIWGAGRVLVIADDDAALAMARRLWLGDVCDLRQTDAVRWTQDLTAGAGADVVMDSSGTGETIGLALRLACRGGRIILAKSPVDDVVLPAASLARVQRDELTLRGAGRPRNASAPVDEWAVSAMMIASRRLDVRSLIGHRFPLERAPEALAMLVSGGTPVARIMLEMVSEEGRLD